MSTGSAHRTEPRSFFGNVVDDEQPLGFTWNARTTALIAASARSPEFSSPTNILASSTTANRWVFPTNGARQMGLVLYGRGTDNEWFEAAIRGWRRSSWSKARAATLPNPDTKFGPVWRPREIAVIKGQVGAYIVPADAQFRDPLVAAGETDVRGVDSGSVVSDYTFENTCQFVHEATAGIGMFIFDTMSCELIEVEAACALPSGEAGTPVDSLNGFYFRI